jgi:hypothetical protein
MVLVQLRGDVTAFSASACRRVLDAAGRVTDRVVVDLSALDDVDPALALVLLEVDDRLARSGGWLWLVHGPGRAGSSLRFIGVHDRIRSSPSLLASGWGGRSVAPAARHLADPATGRRGTALTPRRPGRLVRTRR